MAAAPRYSVCDSFMVSWGKSAWLRLGLDDEVEVHGAAVESKGLDDSALEITPVRLRELLLPVAEQPNPEGPMAGLRRIVDAEPSRPDRRRRSPFGEVRKQLVELGRGQLLVEGAVEVDPAFSIRST